MKFMTIPTVAGLLLSGSSAVAATLVFEDFEDTTVGYTTNVTDDLSDINNNDYYGRVAAADLPSGVSYSNVQGDSFFAVQDTDGATNATDEVHLNWTGIDISAYTDLALSFALAEDTASDGNEDWDSNTSLQIFYQIDGGGYVLGTAFEAELGDGGFFNKAPRQDTNLDGVGDGTAVTDSFTTFGFDIADGSVLDLRVSFFEFTAADEDVAFDNLLLTGTDIPMAAVPLPAGGVLLLSGFGGFAAIQRRKKRAA